ncbi:MAG: hypothetical protein LBE81_10470 [Azonexus sp.]|jgi:hypothetical protein|uniref:hypothetical protein n=1 Tax=Azonexus sp. TaxID=1872668 RepID=UPI0028367F93|nr:hypothetical protein [Azonexus sp.]MDR0777043.1 hypothetical protein [Azonexus sp.]
MTIPLQRLRDLLPFSLPPAGRESVPAVGRWPAADGAPLHRVIAHIDDVLLPQIIRQRGLLQRFRQLEAACQEAEPALAELEHQISAAPLPLPPATQAAILEADNLIKRLAQCYGNIARSVVERQGSEPAPLFYRSTQRTMAMLVRRQLLAHRACTLPSASSWRQLHTLYRMACDPSLQALNGDTAPIEHEYLGALLLAYFDPQRQPRSDLDAIHRCARQLAAYAVISEATIETLVQQTTEARFLVRSEEGHPGLPLSRLAANSPFAGGLLVDCDQVLAAIDRNLSRQPGKPVQPELAAAPALLQCLRVTLGGRCARRFSRTRFRPRADLVGGLDAVIHFLDGNTYTRRTLDAPGLLPGGRALTTGEWSLIDESPDGFLVRFVRGEQSRFSAGQVVVLQPRESSRTHVCLVRRVGAVRNRLELGLQLLSPQVSVVALPDGGRAIFLHSLPAYGPYAGLITAPDALHGRQQLILKVHGRPIERHIGRMLEANEELEFVALEPRPH